MICEEVMEYMQRHLDNDLNGDELKKLNEHLAACPDCAEMMERLRRVDMDLANLPKVVPAYSLVDAILPRLEQIDAEMRAEKAAVTPVGMATEKPAETRSASGRDGAALPRLSRGWMRYGSVAAAAVVLGVLVVNGLSDSFGDSLRFMGGSSGSSAETATSGGSGQAALFSASGTAEIARAPEPDAGNVGDAVRKAQPARPAEGAAGASPDTPVSSDGGKSGSAPGASGAASGGGVAAPAPSREIAPASPGAAKDKEGEVAGILSAPEMLDVNANAASGETPSEGADAAAKGNAASLTAVPDGEPAQTMQFVGMVVADPYGAALAAPVYSEDGGFAAAVRMTEDGRIAVHIDLVRDGALENRYVSVHRWDAEAAVEIAGWEGTRVTYTVKTENDVRTFTIDAATGAESEID